MPRIYVPYTALPVHEGFHRTVAREAAAFGAVGSGKTIALCGDVLGTLLDYPGIRAALCRKSIPSLRDTTESEFVGLITAPPDDDDVEHDITTLWDVCTVRRSGGHIDRIYFPNGSELLFRSLDDWRKLMSLNLGYIGIDEASEIDEITYVNLMSRLRQKQPTPQARRMGYKWTGEPRQKMRIALNPNGRDWAWEYFVNNPTSDRRYWRSSSFDNPTLYNADGTPSEYLTSLLQMPLVWVMRMVLCEFDAFEGQIYPFDITQHSHTHFEPPTDWERGMGLDWGIRSPTHIGWWARSPGSRKWYKYREWQSYDHTKIKSREAYVSMGVAQVAAAIKALEKGERVRWRGADPIIWKKSAQDGDNKSIASLFQEHGLHFEPGAKGYSDRISTVVNMIHAGELSVSDNCPITQVAYQQYRWSDVSPSRATDAPERPHKKDDHPCDADQYLFTLFTPKNATIQPKLAPATNDEYIRAIVAEQTKRQRDRMRPRYR